MLGEESSPVDDLGGLFIGEWWAAKGYLEKITDRHYRLAIAEFGKYWEISSYLNDLERWTVFNKDSKQGCKEFIPVFFAGGGGVLFDRYGQFPLIKRSGSAPTNPGKFTIPTGRFDSTEEILEPDLMVRELWEEVVVYKCDKIVPGWQLFNPEKFKEEFGRECLDTLTICWEEKESRFEGWVSIGSRFEINAVIPVYTDVDLSEFRFEDGEKDHNGRNLGRQVKLCSANAQDFLFDEKNMTEHAMTAFHNIRSILGGCKRSGYMLEEK